MGKFSEPPYGTKKPYGHLRGWVDEVGLPTLFCIENSCGRLHTAALGE
ncbi:hypothetical protein AR1Y2_1229 [Anaerostipes rhamnosivorans]|uniref:Uncharacterized protein n=1 Tax=Anaerostipes rhamnosivorans TaxID=1229621 RepID=A0A4P8IFL8_9FIRM|nr:hypothetical protein AR1Y2_1229 [Anaerostipes rhamnosivorans]